jgi:hypothetical protein
MRRKLLLARHDTRYGTTILLDTHTHADEAAATAANHGGTTTERAWQTATPKKGMYTVWMCVIGVVYCIRCRVELFPMYILEYSNVCAIP